MKDHTGDPTAILGYGLAVGIYSAKDGNNSFGMFADRETWSGYHGYQYRGGLIYNHRW
jgi:hypothetical protein